MVFFKENLFSSVQEIINEDSTNYYFLNHKELVTSRDVHIDLINVILHSIELFITEIVKDSIPRNQFEDFSVFVIDYYKQLEQLLTMNSIRDKFVYERLKKAHLNLQSRIASKQFTDEPRSPKKKKQKN